MSALATAAIINGIAQLAASGVGAYLGNQRRKEAEALVEARKNELKADMAAPFVDRADSQAILRNLRQNQKEQRKFKLMFTFSHLIFMLFLFYS